MRLVGRLPVHRDGGVDAGFRFRLAFLPDRLLGRRRRLLDDDLRRAGLRMRRQRQAGKRANDGAGQDGATEEGRKNGAAQCHVGYGWGESARIRKSSRQVQPNTTLHRAKCVSSHRKCRCKYGREAKSPPTLNETVIEGERRCGVAVLVLIHIMEKSRCDA
jgi:hypothetical protein